MESAVNFRLNDQIILITGATGHLGQAISRGIVDAGGIAVICGRKASKLNILADELRATGGRVYSVCCDLVDVDSCKSMIAQLKSEFGKLDGIVNCAHDGRAGTIESTDSNDFNLAQKIHVSTPFFLVQAGLDLLREAALDKLGGASVVNIASMYGQVSPDPRIYGTSGSNNPPYYGAAKAGMIQLTRYMACHLGEYNIRINSVCPGPFPPESVRESNIVFYENLCKKNPLGRIGLAHEIIGPVVFLLSAASSFVTGSNLVVDGGWTSW
ncbi:MAG: SDR family oxidoreductase [Legionellaceae bacterium]|nr:SDR family oxidoreductase [Legionellaceae bacterium]